MKRRTLLTVLIVLTLVFIWGNSLLSREASSRISDTLIHYILLAADKLGLSGPFFSRLLNKNDPSAVELSTHLLRKAAHIAEFAVFSTLVWLRLDEVGKRRFGLVLLFGVAVAGLDETIQIFSHRGSQLRDVGIDTAGVLLGLLLVTSATKHRRKKQGSENS